MWVLGDRLTCSKALNFVDPTKKMSVFLFTLFQHGIYLTEEQIVSNGVGGVFFGGGVGGWWWWGVGLWPLA